MAAPNPALPGDVPAHASLNCLYRDFYSDATNDPFNGNYAPVLQPYGIALANQNAATPVQVQELACDCHSQNIPTAFLLLHGDGKLRIYLQVDKFKTRMGPLPATVWDDTMFAQKGELHHNNGQLVIWRQNYFRQVAIRVPLADTIDAAFAGDAVALQLGPFEDGDAGTEPIRVRRTCYGPPAYVPLFLAGNLSPREAWMAVHGQIVIDNRAQECAVLVDYLRAAMICRINALVMSNWFKKRKRVAGIISPPDLDKFFDKIAEDDNWESIVPLPALTQLGLQSHHQGSVFGLQVRRKA
jgi:hypothetical protein